LMQAEVDGQSLSDEEIVSFAAVLLLGGFDTTTYLLANAVRILAERPLKTTTTVLGGCDQ